jgi:hypothetical protein
MGRERFDAQLARIPARIQSALNRGRELAEARRLSHEQGRVNMEAVPVDQEITLMVHPQFVERECLDTRVFDSQVVGYLTPEAKVRRQLDRAYAPSITQQWQDADPAEDRPMNSPQPSRIDPTS